MRFEVTRDARIKGLRTPITIFPDDEGGSFISWGMADGPTTQARAGFSDIPQSAVDALEAGDDSLVRQHVITEPGSPLHRFVDCGVVVETEFGSLCVRNLLEAPGPKQ